MRPAGGKVNETLIGLAGAVFVNIMAQVWLALARQPRRHGWLPYATGTYDVTTTTGCWCCWRSAIASPASTAWWCGAST